eukprot:805266-Amphidinium_carterae.1
MELGTSMSLARCSSRSLCEAFRASWHPTMKQNENRLLARDGERRLKLSSTLGVERDTSKAIVHSRWF